MDVGVMSDCGLFLLMYLEIIRVPLKASEEKAVDW
jgi:hypothetical protein